MRWMPVCVTLLLAGCATPPAAEIPEQATPEKRWNWTDCFGFDGVTYYPFETGPGDAPPGWEFNLQSGRIASDVSLFAFKCDRISMGDFERGPISMIWETHSKFTPPEACEKGQWALMSVVSLVIVNDQEVAAYLLERGVPAVVSDILVEQTTAASLQRQIWSWDLPGGRSTIEAATAGPHSDTLPFVHRWVWWDNQKLTMADFEMADSVARAPIPLLTGSLSDDMLYSRDAPNQFAATGDYNSKITMTEKSKFVGDASCAGL